MEWNRKQSRHDSLAGPREERDERIKARHVTWVEYVVVYFILLVLSAGQAMIMSKYLTFDAAPAAYIFGMLGYWAIVTAVSMLVIHFQKVRAYDRPLQTLGRAARRVAAGDFSVSLPPRHTADKLDYMDVMFEDFNRMVEELGSIEALKNDFIANVSHEIKTPLSVIQSYAMALQKEDLPAGQRREYAETIVVATHRLNALVTNILKLNKLEHQEIQPKAETYDVCRQLCDCALAFEDLWERKGITFLAELEDRAMIHADAGMMEIVWNNLLANALKFTDSGGTVTLRQISRGNTITVSVSDTGCGIDGKALPHIFEKFYQADASRAQEGNGLGLPLVGKVLELCGGTISVQSEVNAGTTFSVVLKTA